MTATYGDLAYLYYFAIRKEERNKHYGSEVFASILEKYKKYRFFLLTEYFSKDTPHTDFKQKRHAFYTRNHMINSNIVVDEFGVEYFLYYYLRPVSYQDYQELCKHLLSRFLFKYYFENNLIEK